MTGVAVALMVLGFLCMLTPYTFWAGLVLMPAGFGCVAIDNHNHDEGR